MALKPQNIVQAAEADMKRALHNIEKAVATPGVAREAGYEPYAFHRKHVRRADTAHSLIVLALMDPAVAEKTAKANTRLIYGDARLLVEAARMSVTPVE